MALDFTSRLPSHAEWMKNTEAGPLNPRSAALKKLDLAIQSQNQASIATALHEWQIGQQKTNGDWKKSIRNKSGAVQRLDDFLNNTQRTHLSDADKDILNFIDSTQITALAEQFKHCELVYQKHTTGALASSAASKLDKLKGAVKQKGAAAGGALLDIQSGLSDAFTQIAHTVPGLSFDFVLNHIGLPSAAHIAATVTPYIGVIKSGVTACRGLATAGVGIMHGVQMHQAGPAVREGDATAALEAIRDILTEDMAFNASKTAVAGTAFAAKVAGFAGDLGTATTAGIGIGETLATIFLEFTEFCVQYSKFKAGNEHLKGGVIDKKLFEKCPLLGCYYVLLQPQSTIVNFDLAHFGLPGWMNEYDRLRKQASVVRELAVQYIQRSKYQLKGEVEVITPSGTITQSKTDAFSSHPSTLSKVGSAASTALGMVPEGPGGLVETAAGAKEGVIGLIHFHRRPKQEKTVMPGFGGNTPFGNSNPVPAPPPPPVRRP